jgi:HEAT repeats
MRFHATLAAALILSCPPGPGAEPVMDVYVSTGDNHFLGSSLPVDSPASIEATFDLFKNVNHARRIYWRGLEEACWISTMHARPENPRYFSLWTWMQWLYANVKPDQVAVKAARARGMEIWGMGTLWDWGSPAGTPTFNDYPFPFESKLKLEHPEWAPVDQHGARRQGGPIELAYPDARKALLKLIVDETLKAGYDGICFLTYVENYSLRFQDEFGYSDPIVEDFKKQYKLDLRKEPFRRGASREDWLRLRGNYVTAFLRELKAELDKHKIKLGMVLNSNDPRQPQSWNVPELVLTAGSQVMDVDTWVREGLVDELIIYGNNSSASQLKTLQDMRFLTRNTRTEVSVMTSGPFREMWQPFQAKGMPTLLAVSDDAQHLERGFVPEQTAGALAGQEVYPRMRALQQGLAGTLKLDEASVAAAAGSPNLIERRLALLVLGKSKTADLKPLLAGLDDGENGVRCAAALALADRKDAAACKALLRAAEQHGNHMLRECVVIALRQLSPTPVEELSEAALHSTSGEVREVAMRALQVHAKPGLVPVFKEGLRDKARFPRFAAAEALGNVTHSAEAVELLIAALNDSDPAVTNRAAASLGKLVALKQAETGPLRPKILAALTAAFEKHSDAKRADADWGWRPVGNAMLECGEEGAAALRRIRDQRADARLAGLAWQVVDLPQRSHAFSVVSPEENEAAMKRRPQVARDIRVGVDVKTIHEAIKLAQPGDTIHLQPIVYHDYAGFYGKKGEPGRPVTLDGHGATLEGSDPLDPAKWKEVSPGLFANGDLLPARYLDDAVLVRWFFLWDGQMNLMGRTSKGKKAPFKKLEDLEPGEWTFIEDKSREKAGSKLVAGTFYVKIPPGQKLADARICAPVRSAGVQLSGDNAHLVIRNLTCTHPYNDGFNIHGDCRDVVFENIRAIECGDDGISAHESAEYRVDHLVSIGNSTGIADTVAAHTSYNHVFIAGIHAMDLLFIMNGRYKVENAVILSSSEHPLSFSARDGEHCELSLHNVLIRRLGKPEPLLAQKNTLLRARCVTLENTDVLAKGEVQFDDCLINGRAKPDGSKATGADKATLVKEVVPPEYQSQFAQP